MVTDLGGFAASTFKRGIDFINIPTTLLAMVDASVGGKTGVNFGGLKNEIGVFCDSRFVILDTLFLNTLDHDNICSGYAEMLKHGLLSDDRMWSELLTFPLCNPDLQRLQLMLAQSVRVKEKVVEADPLEKNIRKALNLGHTVGHALESLAMRKGQPVLHGYAVAWAFGHLVGLAMPESYGFRRGRHTHKPHGDKGRDIRSPRFLSGRAMTILYNTSNNGHRKTQKSKTRAGRTVQDARNGLHIYT